MTDWAVIDSNLLLLLVVGRADPDFIAMHKRLRDDYTKKDYGLLEGFTARYARIVVVPQVLAEVSNFAFYLAEPARGTVLDAFRAFVTTTAERWIQSVPTVKGRDFRRFGLTDATLLRLCAEAGDGMTLITADRPLAYRAQSLGYSVINFGDEQGIA